MLMTSLLAGIYVYVTVLRRRTMLRPASRDHARGDSAAAHATTMIGGNWRSRGLNVDGDLAAATTTPRSVGNNNNKQICTAP